MDLFNLMVRISVNIHEYEKKLTKAERQAVKFQNKLSTNILKGVGNVAKGMTKVAKVAGAGIAVLGGIALKYNSDMESYTTNFKVMLGSQEAAIAKVEELKKMANKTPFGMGELANATQVLLSFGVSAEKTTPILQTIGDVSLGNKEKFNSLALAFGQVQSSGKLMGQDLMQMVNQGFNPLQIISQETGKSMSQLKDEMSKGSITADMVTSAFASATAEGGKFHNGMQEASTTTAGLMSTLKDEALSKAGELFQIISDKLKDIIPNVIKFVQSIDTKKIVENISNLATTFVNLLPVITGVTTALVAFAISLKIVAFVSAMAKAVRALQAAFVILNIAMKANIFIAIASAILGLIVAFVTLIATNKEFRDFLINFFTVEIPNAIKAVFVFFDNLPLYFALMWQSILQFFVDGWNNIILFFTESLPKFIKQVEEFFDKLPYYVGYVIGLMLIKFVNFTYDLMAWARAELPILMSKIGEFFKELPSKIWDAIIKAKDKFIEWVNNLIETAKVEVPRFVNKVIEEAGKLPGKFVEVGKNVVDGFVNGIKNNIERAKTKVRNFFGGITDGVMQEFDQHSPSKVFEKIGKNNDDGYVNGVLRNAYKIKNAMHNVFGKYNGTSINSNMNMNAVVSTKNDGFDYNLLCSSIIYSLSNSKMKIDKQGFVEIINENLGVVY
ncbi:MAG: tape measure protein [Clostridia bacterium]